ncbi:MAG TPA: hypothetical protein VHE13_09705 [Opitutus sp.]|nr:hypothetical protein [Opitutus sp.]
MNHPIHIDVARYPRRVRWFMGAAWVIILAKCTWVWWAVEHWNMPFHPLWVVGPTLVFALLITGLWLMHHEA